MNVINKIRKWVIKKLLKDSDGYTFTGFSESEPIKFYYKADTNEYLLGKRTDRFYYGRPGLSGWTFGMSKHLDWGSDLLGEEPKEIAFGKWISGILENIHQQFMGYRRKQEDSK